MNVSESFTEFSSQKQSLIGERFRCVENSTWLKGGGLVEFDMRVVEQRGGWNVIGINIQRTITV